MNVPVKLLRLPQVLEVTGLKRSTIYAKMDRNEFPKAIQIGLRAVAWPEDEIFAWQESRRARRRHEAVR